MDSPVPEAAAVPCAAWVEMLQVRVPESISVAFKVSAKAVGVLSSDIVTEVDAPWVITGASLAALMVTFTVMVSVRVPSETWTTKLSAPL